MKYILTPNQKHPFNLIRISLPYFSDNLHFASEQDMIDFVIALRQERNRDPDGAEYHVVDPDDLPGGVVSSQSDEDYFFDAWEWNDGVNVNMTKARVIHMDNIRAIRNRELAAKDISFMRAVEDGNADAQATIKTEKQNLRDIPQTFDITTGVDTPEQLKEKWPDGLPKE